MLVIKLAQVGKTNKRMFRLIISEKSRDPFGRALEILGSYNPHSKELQSKNERIKFWLSKGAQMTATVNNLLVEKKVIEAKKVKASKVGKPNKKKTEQAKAKSDKKEDKKNESKTENSSNDTKTEIKEETKKENKTTEKEVSSEEKGKKKE